MKRNLFFNRSSIREHNLLKITALKVKMSLLVLFALLGSLTISAQTLATFEEGNSDFLTTYLDDSDSQITMTVVNNPLKDNVNGTDKSLLVYRPELAWTDNVSLVSDGGKIDINESNRYLHMMVYCEEEALIRMTLLRNENEGAWSGVGDDVNFTAGKWTDLVYDLLAYKEENGTPITFESIFGICFLGHWNGSPERSLYFDEIVLNNNPLPRELLVEDETELVTFEENVVYDSVGGACKTLEVVDNPEKDGLNGSSKSLYGTTPTEFGDWWGGINVFFDKKIHMNEDTRYLHLFMKTNLRSFEFFLDYSLADPNKTWFGRIDRENPSEAIEWTEYVIDMEEYAGDVLESIRIVTFPNEEGQHGKYIYIDEIIVNADATPRSLTSGENKTYSLGGKWAVNPLAYMLENANSVDVRNATFIGNDKITPSNPNCLIYANSAIADNNIIIADQQTTIELTDGYPFYCPEEFEAATITYNRECWQDGGYETICIPFALNEGWSELREIASSDNNSVAFRKVEGGIEANKPYIIKWPEASSNKEEAQTITLSTSNVTIPVTNDLTATAESGSSAFVGTYSEKAEAGIYILQSDNQFKRVSENIGDAKLAPFRAYLTGEFNSSADMVKLNFSEDGPTGIKDNAEMNTMEIISKMGAITINTTVSCPVALYTVDGKLVYNGIIEEGVTTINNLSSGLYILNNNKVAVK